MSLTVTYGRWHSRRTARFGLLVRIAVIAFAGVVISFQIYGWLGIRINTSPSLPLGFYIATSDAAGGLIEFCPTEPFASFALSRGYRDRGSCRDGGAPLLKPIVARPGDVVEFSSQGISVNGKLLPNTQPLAMDTKGRSLRPWPFGSYAVKPGSVWVGSSYNKRSFDSRYFGPVPTSSIRERLRPLLTLW
jgi:conjugative transfer signal peptidase TraF